MNINTLLHAAGLREPERYFNNADVPVTLGNNTERLGNKMQEL